MKKPLLIGLVLVRLPVFAVDIGDSRDAVLAELGEPQGSMRNGGKEILLFKTGSVTLQNGSAVKTDLSPDYARQAEERALELEKIRAVKQAELEKQKLLCPEDHVIRINCAYGKTEDWTYLPESIRPAAGQYRYDIYIPPGYHQSESRRYPCLFLESPALWDSVKELVRKEEWIAVVLPDAGPQEAGKTMNSGFLAAYDDAAGRFRISQEYLFIAGRVPAAVFSTMRPVAGIILQEPDFSGFEKTGFRPDFLRKNRNLRVYALLGNRSAENVRYQGSFIVEHIPKHCVEVYEGSTGILSQPAAEQAVNWMKKEYSMP